MTRERRNGKQKGRDEEIGVRSAVGKHWTLNIDVREMEKIVC